MEKLKTKSGEIHFKMPNLIETPRFLGKLGINRKEEINEYELYAKVLEEMGVFIKEINVEVDGKKIEKYQDLWELPEWQKPLYKMANKILSAMNDGVDDKKK